MFERQLAALADSPRQRPENLTPPAMKRRKMRFAGVDSPDSTVAIDSTHNIGPVALFSTPSEGQKKAAQERWRASEEPPPANINPFFVAEYSGNKMEDVTPLTSFSSITKYSSICSTGNKSGGPWESFESPVRGRNDPLRQVSPGTPARGALPKFDKISSPGCYLSRKLRRTCSLVSVEDGDIQTDENKRSMPNKRAKFQSATPQPPPPPAPPIAVKNRRRTIGESKVRDEERSAVEFSRFKYEFEVLGVLGGGSFGTVYKCKARLDGCLYAVKVTNQGFKGKADRERVLKEVYALAALCHTDDNPHVVRYFSAWVEDGRLYIQTELCDMSLQHQIRQKLESHAPSAELEKMAVTMARQVLHGLRRLHRQNLVHLDIKPANIFIKNGTYKLGDLGHACLARMQGKDGNGNHVSLEEEMRLENEDARMEDDLDREEKLLEKEKHRQNVEAAFLNQINEGDSRYMARELLQEKYAHLTKGDIFSLGASIYEIALGRELPANGQEWSDIRDGKLDDIALGKVFSEPTQQLVRLLLHPDPERRPSAETLLASGGPGGILRSEAEARLAREKAAADEYRKQLARMKSSGSNASSGLCRMRRSNTL